MNVVGHNAVVINGVASLNDVFLLAVRHFDSAFHYKDKLFAFVRGKDVVKILCIVNVNDKGFHVAVCL